MSGVATDKRPFGRPCLAEAPISVHSVALQRPAAGPVALPRQSRLNGAGFCAATDRRPVRRPRRAKSRINGPGVAPQPSGGQSDGLVAPSPGSADGLSQGNRQAAIPVTTPPRCQAQRSRPCAATDRRSVGRPRRAKSRISGWAVAGQPTSGHSGDHPDARISGPAPALQPSGGQSDGLVAPSPGSAGGLSQCNRQAAIPVTTPPRCQDHRARPCPATDRRSVG